MDTINFIKALAADTRAPTGSLSSIWWGATGIAVTLAAIVFLATLAPRPDIAEAAETPRFLFKLVITITLTVTAFILARAMLRPEETGRKIAPYLAIAPVLAAAGVVAELFVLPQDIWSARLIGTNSMACLFFITMIGVGPLALFLLALRHGAPARPIIAGAVAGVLAGGIAASLYGLHCTDDSPLFVASWYTIAIGGLALAGAVGADRFVRW
jgi:hypothetical protein